MTVWIYVDTRKQVGEVDHLKVFANAEVARAWFAEHDPEGVAFEYSIIGEIEQQYTAGLEMGMLRGGIQSLVRALAVELHASGHLDDQALERIERRGLQSIKNAQFVGAHTSDAEQVRLMNIAIEAVNGEMQYLRHNRDAGNLKP